MVDVTYPDAIAAHEADDELDRLRVENAELTAELDRVRGRWAAAWLAVCHGEQSFGIDGTKWVRADRVREALAHKETAP